MDSNQKFWVSINAIVAFAIVMIIFISINYWNNFNTKIVEMIADGVDPVEAMCALQNDYGKMPVCMVIATKKEN